MAVEEAQNPASHEERIHLHEEKDSSKAMEESAEKAAVGSKHDPSTRSEAKVKTQNPAQSAIVKSNAPEQRNASRDNHPANTTCPSGTAKRAWTVAVPLIAPGKPRQSVEPPKTKSRASSKAEVPAVTRAEGNPQEENSQKTAGKDFNKKGSTPKKQKKPTVDNKEEPSSMQAQPPRYVPGANWVEEPKDNKGSKKRKALQSTDKNSSAQKGDGSPSKDKDSAAAPSGPTTQPAPPMTEPQATEKGQTATDKAGDSTMGPGPVANTTNDTLSQKPDGGLQTEAQAADTTNKPSTAQTPTAVPGSPPVPTTQLSQGQKKKNNKKKAKAAARKKAQAENAATAEPAPAPATSSSPAKDGPSPLAPAPEATSPKKPGRAPTKTQGKDDGGSPETLLEGEERK